MEIRFCSKCGAEAVIGKVKCPHCNAYYDSSYEQHIKEEANRIEADRIREENERRNTNNIIKIVAIFLAVCLLMIFAAVFIPAYIGYNARKSAREKANENYINYDYDDYDDHSEFDEEYNFGGADNEVDNEYSSYYESDIKTLDEAVEIFSGRCSLEKDGEYTDDFGDYVRYISNDDLTTYDFYTDEVGNVREYIITLSEGHSEWIMENDLYDSILQNSIAENLMDVCGYSWGDAQDYLDNIDIEIGMAELDETGHWYFLELEDNKLSFMIVCL